MENKEVQDIEEAILTILQNKDYIAISEMVRNLAGDLKKRLGLSARSNTATAVKQLRPYIRGKLQVYKGPRATYIGKRIPLEEIIFNYINANPNLSPLRVAQRIPAVKSEFIAALNAFIEAGSIRCTFKNNPDCTPLLKVLKASPLLSLDDRAAFKETYEDIGKGKSFVDIYRIRRHLGWPRERFDAVLCELKRDYAIQLHGGDPSSMTEQAIQDSYMDENNILYLTLTWKRK
jgi:hypothetical protein